jgi:hypothetical protein
MATAIARTYTQDGFAIAADGRMRNGETRQIITDETQKIFPFGPGNSLACSFTGQIELTPPEDSKKVVFDFISQVGETVKSVARGGCHTLAKFAETFSEPIWRSLERAQLTHSLIFPEDPSVYPGERGCTIATILIDGYYEGQPSRVNIRFYCEHQKLAEPEVSRRDLDEGKFLLYGFPEIGELLSAGDARFVGYLKPVDRSLQDSEALWQTICFSRSYIDACSGPEALAMNEQICSAIGGHIHIATITAASGFAWVAGFAPRLASPTQRR